jgi:hypothetical protein
MNPWIRCSLLATCVLLVHPAGQRPARADFVTVITGSFAGVEPPTSMGMSLPSFTLTMGTVSATAPASSLGGSVVSDLTVDVTPFSPTSTAVDLPFPALVLTFSPTETALFGLSSPGFLDPNDPTLGTGTITTDAFLVSSSIPPAVADLTLFLIFGGTLEVLFDGISVTPGTPGTASWPTGAAVAPTRFVLSARLPPQGPIPEPASLTLTAVGLLTLAGVAWSRYRHRASG